MSLLVVRCPAKINPVLRVLGRRPDGFHELDLTFTTLALSDDLALERSDEVALTVVGAPPDEVPVGDNLVVRAARALQAEVGPVALPGARMALTKRVPAAAGLGGGSSDAAGALEGLARLWGLALAPEVLPRLALALGSDVPYFLAGGHQRGRGRGERLEALPEGPDRPVLLVRPRLPLSTRRVFETHAKRSGGDLTTRKIGPTFEPESGVGDGDVLLANDLWDAAVELEPRLRAWRDRLEAGFRRERVGLSGSGPTLFALGDGPGDEEPLRRLAATLTDPDVDVVLTRTLGRSEYRATRFRTASGPVSGEVRQG